MVQATNHHTEISLASRYFKGYFFSCNMFGYKAINCYRMNMKIWAYNKRMEKKISANIPKGENIITLKGMKEEGITVKKMWHSSVYR